MPPRISPKLSPAVGKICIMSATAGLNMKLLLAPMKAAEITYPTTTASARPPATTAAKVKTLRLYLSARAKKNAIIAAPSNSIIAIGKKPFSARADIAGMS